MNRSYFQSLSQERLVEVADNLHILATELWEKQQQNSENSSQPPSKDNPYRNNQKPAAEQPSSESATAEKVFLHHHFLLAVNQWTEPSDRCILNFADFFGGGNERLRSDGFRLNTGDRTFRVDSWDVCGDNTMSHLSADQQVNVSGEFSGLEFDAFSVTDLEGSPICALSEQE